jgi:hypothetical protein
MRLIFALVDFGLDNFVSIIIASRIIIVTTIIVVHPLNSIVNTALESKRLKKRRSRFQLCPNCSSMLYHVFIFLEYPNLWKV